MKSESAEGGTLETWTVDEVAEALERREIVLIDVRTPPEYMVDHIEGALLMPLPFFAPSALPTQAGKRLVFHCGSGARSGKASHQALKAGIDPVAHLEGGMGAWKKAGRPHIAIDMATGAPKRVDGSGD